MAIQHRLVVGRDFFIVPIVIAGRLQGAVHAVQVIEHVAHLIIGEHAIWATADYRQCYA